MPIQRIQSLPTARVVGGLCADDIGTQITFTSHGKRHTLRIAAVHHDTGTEGRPVTYIANERGDSHMLASDTPIH